MIYEISGNVITCTDERGSVPTSGRLLGASPVPRPDPPTLPAATFTTGVITPHCARCGGRARVCCGSLVTWLCKSCCKSHGAHAVEYVGSACHPKCTVGAPCRRAKCANAVNADSEERRINAMAPPQCPHGNAQGYCKQCGHELPRPRPYSLGSDPLAAMLRTPGVCVMRGRRW